MATVPPRQVWLADWSDEEQEQFVTGAAEAGVAGAVVLRSAPLGQSVGSRLHRLRSWPAYAGLAWRGRRQAGPEDVLVAWQPLAGALALLPGGRRRAVVVLNPILHAGSTSPRQRAVVRLLRRADRVVLYSSQGREDAVALGLPRERTVVVPLGVQPRPDLAPPRPDGLVLAAGRDHRDWEVLAEASRLSGVEVQVAGPDRVPDPLRLLRPADRQAFADLVAGSRAVVVPLRDATRQAGTLAVLDALAAGRPVLATDGPGTRDYVTGACGRLVPAGDARALADALLQTQDEGTVGAWAQGAREAAQGLSMAAFVARVQEVACEARATRTGEPCHTIGVKTGGPGPRDTT